MHGQVGRAAVYLALFKNGVERQNPMFAIVNHQHTAQGIAHVMNNFSVIEHKASYDSTQ
jgi:hypothetical protein